MTRIRDPIHGSIEVDRRELAVLDSPVVQRLRGVRQLGFSEMAFPGATHARYAHALGACHVVGQLLETILGSMPELPKREAERLRAAARVAVLLHDCGHAPFSHSSEAVMPLRAKLALPDWVRTGPAEEQASHEDYTLKLVLQSSLTEVLRAEYAELDISPEAIAGLLAGRPAPEGPCFVVGGIDHEPLLRQVISSELDADRMDYLLRDSFYTGVNYGKYDFEWLAGQLRARVHEGRAELALRHRGIFAFEDFLLSRYHMFISVYHHHTPVCFDRMLLSYYRENPGEFEIPHEAEAFLDCDDLALIMTLRQSESPWAERILRRRPYRVIYESSPYGAGRSIDELTAPLEQAGIACFTTRSRSLVSKYFGTETAPDRIWVEPPEPDSWVLLEEYTPLFRRYEKEARIERIYVDPERADEARRLTGLRA